MPALTLKRIDIVLEPTRKVVFGQKGTENQRRVSVASKSFFSEGAAVDFSRG